MILKHTCDDPTPPCRRLSTMKWTRGADDEMLTQELAASAASVGFLNRVLDLALIKMGTLFYPASSPIARRFPDIC